MTLPDNRYDELDQMWVEKIDSSKWFVEFDDFINIISELTDSEERAYMWKLYAEYVKDMEE